MEVHLHIISMNLIWMRRIIVCATRFKFTVFHRTFLMYSRSNARRVHSGWYFFTDQGH